MFFGRSLPKYMRQSVDTFSYGEEVSEFLWMISSIFFGWQLLDIENKKKQKTMRRINQVVWDVIFHCFIAVLCDYLTHTRERYVVHFVLSFEVILAVPMGFIAKTIRCPFFGLLIQDTPPN